MDKKFKIGVTCYPIPGGSGVVASELGIQLAKRGHQVHFVSYSIPFRLSNYQENLFFHQADITQYPLFKYPPYTLTLASKMAEVARTWELDILHVHYAIPHAVCAFLAKSMLGKDAPKVITTLHGTDITLVGMEKSFYEITKFSIEASDKVTAVSEYLCKQTKSEFAVQHAIDCIYNFVDTTRFKPDNPACAREKFAPKGEKIIMHMSNFRPVKRSLDVIKIFAGIKKEIPSKLVLVGEGPELEPALSLARELCVRKDITLLGQQEFVENILCLADLFLIPSDTESFGLSALEALSCGVPVIGTNLGGLPEVVKDGECGYLLGLGQTEAMAKKCVELLSDQDKLQNFKTNARKRAVEKFDAELLVPKYESLYMQSLN
ncbi:MAG: N-acetyl-alpha-D-glucosaminyl L-malate synthase BshA [candidate division Zixibacteria bacterium]|nr:N-acetyl-alpha-D-glucosaminyl L-malate synthase BshA [candidate division Zixibacteria bacterium]